MTLNRRVTCAAGYDAPKWVTVFLKEARKLIKSGEKFYGDVEDIVDKAIENCEKGYNTAIEETEGFFDDSVESIKDVVGDIGVWAEGAGDSTKTAFVNLGSDAVKAANDVGAAFTNFGNDLKGTGEDIKEKGEDIVEFVTFR